MPWPEAPESAPNADFCHISGRNGPKINSRYWAPTYSRSVTSRAGEPAVSVVIPTYNSLLYLEDALKGLRCQTIDPAETEIIVIDDGSTDYTEEFLDQESHDWPQLIILRQENSGRPGAVRNVGLKRATGRHVFFHDADDWLAPHALERLVAAADEHGADIVIGRVRTIGAGVDRRSSIRPSLDADLIEDRVWNSLAPLKLFRRRLLQQRELSFPEDMAQGEDQVFVAAALFAASRVITLTDDDYYFRRRRDDGGNLSRRAQTFDNKVLTTSRVTRLITENVPPEARSAYLERILLRTLPPGLGGPFMKASPAEREAGLTRLKRDVLPHLDDALLDRATDLARLRLSVAALGSVEDLVTLNRWIPTRPVTVRAGAVVYDLPPELERLLPADRREVREPVQGPHRVLSSTRLGRELSLMLSIDPGLRRVRPDRAVLEFRQRDGARSASVEGRIEPAGEIVGFEVRPVQLARSVAGPAGWTIRCTFFRAGVSLSSAPISWHDDFATDSLCWKSRSATATFVRTKRDNVRLDTNARSWTDRIGRGIGAVGRRLRRRS